MDKTLINNQTTSNYKMSEFWNSSLLEAQALKSKIQNEIIDLQRSNSENHLLEEYLKIQRMFAVGFQVVESYQMLISKILSSVGNSRPEYEKVFFPEKLKENKDVILHLYPQTMPVDHYKELFDVVGYAPNIDWEKVNQITIKRLQIYQNFQVIQKQIYLQEEYFYDELFGSLRPAKINEVMTDFWKEGRLDSLEMIAQSKGGRLVSDRDKVKVFEVKSQNKTSAGEDIYVLVYATPSFYAYDSNDLFNSTKGNYLFLNKAPKTSTCILSVEKDLLRQDFIKPVDEKGNRFKIKIKIPVNLHRFEVVKKSV